MPSTDPDQSKPLTVGDLVLGSTHGLGGCFSEYAVVKNRPEDIVPFGPVALQQAFEAFSRGEINVGKVVVRCSE